MRKVDYPKEIWPDNTIYFYTDSTRLHKPLFRHPEQKIIVLNQIKKLNRTLGIPVSAFSIAMNHLHVKFYLEFGSMMSKVKQILRGGTSYEHKRRYDLESDLWQSRKILRVVNGKMDLLATGYIIGNLLKHREVSTFNDLYENDFSSFSYMADKYGRENMEELVHRVINVKEDNFGEIDMNELAGCNQGTPADF